VVRLGPPCPAGLIILHDGEGPDVNFNDIIRQVVGAGIGYATKELFYFTEELPLDERVSALRAKTSMVDYLGYLFHNGVVQRNGIYRHLSGVNEQLVIGLNMGMISDQLYGRTAHNGLFRRDGTITYNGWAQALATELLTFNLGTNQVDNIAADERMAFTFFKSIGETVERDFRHEGAYRRNGTVKHTNRVYDTIAFTAQLAVQDRLHGVLKRTGVIQRDGSEQRNGFTRYPHPATEKLLAAMSNSYRESILARERFSTTTLTANHLEDFHKHITRNGFIRRNGRV
jgi:hypothetical protein